jgi:excisionase family DNA binding protein
MDNSNAQLIFFPVQLSEFMLAVRMIIREEIKAENSRKVSLQSKRKILTTDEVATLTNLSKSRIYVLSAAGKIPSIKKGQKLRFYEEQILAWIESGARRTGSEIDAAADESLLK